MSSTQPLPASGPPPSPLLGLPGAVAAEAPDEAVAAHYGDPFAEQRRLAAGTAVVDLSHRGVVRVGGLDRLSWLHSLTTQHLERLPAGEATEALILSPHGHVEHHLTLVDDGEAVWAHVEPGTAGALAAFLTSMRFMLRVEITDLTAEYAVVVLPHEAASPPEAAAPARVDPGPAPIRVVPVGREVFLPRTRLPQLADALTSPASGAWRPAGLWAWEAFRVEAHRPRLGFETDHKTIPNEVGWLHTAVHLNKGCYRGQETVARVHNLGAPPRRLVFLHLDGGAEVLPPHGAPVELDGRQVGFVTSAARHYESGPIAMALVKRNTPAEATLRAGGVPAAQEPVVPVEAPGRRPRLVPPR